MNWYTGLLNNFSGKSFPYILLVLGSIFAIIAFAQFPVDSANLVQSETIWESIALGCFSFILIASSLALIFRDNTTKKKISDKNDELKTLENELNHKSEELFKLHEANQRVKDFLKKNTNDRTQFLCNGVLDILEGIDKNISDFSAEYMNRELAADWINQRIEKWINSIELEDYSDHGISYGDLSKFKDDVAKHLELLCNNIRDSKNSAPLLANPPVPQRFGSSLLYKKALKKIEDEIYRELANEENLSANSMQTMKTYLSNFIYIIGYTR